MTDTTDPRALGEELESKMRARQACRTEAAADTMTHEIGLLVCGHPEMILDALRHRFASPQTAGEVGELVERLRQSVPVLRSWGMSSTAPLVAEAADTIASLTAERDAALKRCEVMRGALERCARIVERNLYHQSEKVEDVTHIAREALGSGGGG